MREQLQKSSKYDQLIMHTVNEWSNLKFFHIVNKNSGTELLKDPSCSVRCLTLPRSAFLPSLVLHQAGVVARAHLVMHHPEALLPMTGAELGPRLMKDGAQLLKEDKALPSSLHPHQPPDSSSS